MGGIAHGFHHQGQQNSSARIIEIPLSSILDVAMVSARENVNIFASFEANWVSRPFRVVTTASCHRETLGANDTRLDTFVCGDKHVLTFVAFEAICRLRYFLVLARESWAIRTAAAVNGAATEMLSCTPTAAQRYLVEVYEAMKGPLCNQVRKPLVLR